MVAYPVHHDRGVHLPLCDLWLDPLRPQERAVVSHAHADHVARHGEVLATAATHRLMAHRRVPAARTRTVTAGERTTFGEATVSLHPAGHIVGSSQVLVEHGGVRVLYSGDIRCRPALTAEPMEHVECDLLIVEATFGHPRYRFPATGEVVDRLLTWCRRTVDAGLVPVLLAYSLGKAQEVLAHLSGAGFRLVVHPTVAAVCRVYAELGVQLPDVEELGIAEAQGAVLVVPPHARGAEALLALAGRRTAVVSGWAVPGGPLPMTVRSDAAFALSDHCDFDDLLAYVERSRARRVLTLCGFADEFAHQLRRRGYDAAALRTSEQLALALA